MKSVEEQVREAELSSAAYDQAGDPIMAGLMRVEAGNIPTRENWKPVHKPSLGPYTETNLKVCLGCGIALTDANRTEPCPSPHRQ